MLLQSQNGVIRVFPAIPAAWQNLRFDNLRAEGAFLVSAIQKGGQVQQIKIRSEKGGYLRLANPFRNRKFTTKSATLNPKMVQQDIITVETLPGMIVEWLAPE